MASRKHFPTNAIIWLVILLIVAVFLVASYTTRPEDRSNLTQNTSQFTEKEIPGGMLEYINKDPGVTILYPKFWRGDTLHETDETLGVVNLPGFVLRLNKYYVGVSRITGYRFHLNPLVQEFCEYDEASESWTVQEGNFHYGPEDCQLPKVSVAEKSFFQANTGTDASSKYEYFIPVMQKRFMLSINTGYKNFATTASNGSDAARKSQQLQYELDTFVSEFVGYNPNLFE